MNLDIKTKIKSIKSAKDNKHLIIAFILLVSLSIYLNHRNGKEAAHENIETIYPDTILPKGFILYPIHLENIEAIRGVIDQYGVIDVYNGTQNGIKSKKLLSKVKIMQAPYNPSEYALLLPDHLSQKMMSESGPFLGVIQNRSEAAEFTRPESEPKVRKINIEYQKGS